MKQRIFLITCIFLFAILSIPACGKTGQAIAGTRERLDQLLAAPDSGIFYYYTNQEKAGYSRYKFPGDGTLVNVFELDMENGPILGRVVVEFGEGGAWDKVVYEIGGNLVNFVRNSEGILISTAGGEQSIADHSDNNVLEDMTPFLIRNILLKYAKKEPGPQSLKAFFVPGVNIQGELEYLGASELALNGKKGKYFKYRLNLPPIYEVHVLCDENHQLYLLSYKAQNGAFIRSGYEELLSFDF